jgi:hypothetical protein
MRFSEYLRTLDEGNYGHEYGQESDAHEEALRANREHAAAKRAESTMAPKPPVEPDPKVGDNLKKIAAAKPAETADDNAKRKEWRDSLRSTGDDGGAKAARENTVKEPNGETMLDPKTGKPFPKTGPLKDWQIPSLREAYTPPEGWRERTPAEEANSVKVNADMDRMEKGKEQMKYAEKKRQREQDKRSAQIKKEEAAAAEKKPLTDWQIPSLKEGSRFNNRPTGNEGPERPAGPNPSEGEDKPDKPVDTERWDGHGKEPDGYEDAGGPIGEDGTAALRKKTVKRESLEIPMRDALGRLSIYSMTESSTPKPLRKALKKAKMGKKLSNKESGNVMNNPKADGSTRTNAAENYKNPQADIDANDAAEGEYRSGGEGTPRQSHLDK